MELFLQIVGWTAFGLVVIVGLLLNVLGLFGNWLILAAVCGAWLFSGFDYFGPWCLLILLAVAALGEVLETLAAGYGTSRFGGGKGAITASLVGSIVGAIVGTPIMPLIGSLAGACLGAFIAALLYEFAICRKKAHLACWTGFGAALGRVAGTFAKLILGFAMLAIAAAMF